jgi:hypothetical protein
MSGRRTAHGPPLARSEAALGARLTRDEDDQYELTWALVVYPPD